MVASVVGGQGQGVAIAAVRRLRGGHGASWWWDVVGGVVVVVWRVERCGVAKAKDAKKKCYQISKQAAKCTTTADHALPWVRLEVGEGA